jgi:hypothetical protein
VSTLRSAVLQRGYTTAPSHLRAHATGLIAAQSRRSAPLRCQLPTGLSSATQCGRRGGRFPVTNARCDASPACLRTLLSCPWRQRGAPCRLPCCRCNLCRAIRRDLHCPGIVAHGLAWPMLGLWRLQCSLRWPRWAFPSPSWCVPLRRSTGSRCCVAVRELIGMPVLLANCPLPLAAPDRRLR